MTEVKIIAQNYVAGTLKLYFANYWSKTFEKDSRLVVGVKFLTSEKLFQFFRVSACKSSAWFVTVFSA